MNSSMKTLTQQKMMESLEALDGLLNSKVTLIIGGGGAMVLAHKFPLATEDVDAFSKGIELDKLDELVKQVAKKLGIPPDWLNPYFSTFTHVLPSDYAERLVNVGKFKNLTVQALGTEDLLIMKCFAGRAKDIPHAKALIKSKPNLKFVEDHIYGLSKRKIPGSDRALDFLDDLLDQE